ncbi:hypothetical protein F442_10678 [Phytophthora nicotianae P10297]|uniref:Uncharacterized protein n=1 Tax=Phytophthora nicotianae P10297 TaxID=1317064 RepID=W2Z859_PHYNI|nr:hypothetical protein F442_10678 [Phytophthora nicotianae P10297]
MREGPRDEDPDVSARALYCSYKYDEEDSVKTGKFTSSTLLIEGGC